MRDSEDEELAKWLAAEESGALGEAEALFSVLYARFLPPLEAPPGLRDRILATARGRGPAFDPGLFWWTRVLVASALGVLGAALAVISPGRAVDLAAELAAVAARLGYSAATMAGAALNLAAGSLGVMSDLANATAMLVTTGAGPIVIVANLLLAMGSFVGLKRLLAPREEYYR
jgi:hypothetical protein